MRTNSSRKSKTGRREAGKSVKTRSIAEDPRDVAWHFEEAAANYAENVAGHFAVTYDYLKRHASRRKAKRIADIACGDGRLAGSVVGSRREVVGLDRSNAMVRRGVAAFPGVRWIIADAHFLPLKSGWFDLVICNLAVPLFQDPIKAVHELQRITAVGGEIVITSLVAAPGGTGPGSGRPESGIHMLLRHLGLSIKSESLLKSKLHIEDAETLSKILEGEVGPSGNRENWKQNIPVLAARMISQSPSGLNLELNFSVLHVAAATT